MEDKDKNENQEDALLEEALKEEDEERRFPPFIILFLFTLVGVLFAIGLSFSTITFLDKNETINSLISSIKGDEPDNPPQPGKENYIITYVENSGDYSNGINLTNQFPTKDFDGKLFEGENYVFNFSIVVGNNTKGAYYEITAVPDDSIKNKLDSKYVKLYLEKNKVGVNESFVNGNTSGKVKTFAEYNESKYSNEAKGKVIYSGYIDDNDIKRGKIDFVMRMWVAEDTPVDNDFSNKSFAVKVNTYAAFLR